jgi:hypothetical protein
MRRLLTIGMLGLAAVAATPELDAQTTGLGIRPMRLEMEIAPGQDRTMSFTIESPPSEEPVRGRLQLTLGDWAMAPDTSVSYHEPGTQPNSAAPWMVLSAGDLTIASGQQRLVRVTGRVPAGVKPGVYTSAIFVQERPPSDAPQAGDHRFYFRFRYVVTVYLIVTPVTSQGELADAMLVKGPHGAYEMKARLTNPGTRHLRPVLDWYLTCGDRQIVSAKQVDATVLLPGANNTETLIVPAGLPAGECQIEIHTDFRDGRPIQAVQRSIVISEPGK